MARNRSPLPIPQMDCPLGDEHCELLNQTLRSCADVRAYLEKLAQLGVDVSDWQQTNQSNEQMATGLKQIHFPNRP